MTGCSGMQVGAIPDICQFWGTTALFRHVKRAPKSAYVRDKIAQNVQNGPIAFYAKRGTSLNKVVTTTATVVTYIS